jgi:hypothetical protein
MRGFLLLSVVGALLYGLLLLTADVPDRKAEHSLRVTLRIPPIALCDRGATIFQH